MTFLYTNLVSCCRVFLRHWTDPIFHTKAATKTKIGTNLCMYLQHYLGRSKKLHNRRPQNGTNVCKIHEAKIQNEFWTSMRICAIKRIILKISFQIYHHVFLQSRRLKKRLIHQKVFLSFIFSLTLFFMNSLLWPIACVKQMLRRPITPHQHVLSPCIAHILYVIIFFESQPSLFLPQSLDDGGLLMTSCLRAEGLARSCHWNVLRYSEFSCKDKNNGRDDSDVGRLLLRPLQLPLAKPMSAAAAAVAVVGDNNWLSSERGCRGCGHDASATFSLSAPSLKLGMVDVTSRLSPIKDSH